MVTKILASPENATFRNIKKENPYYHQDLGQFEGGDMCLIALGFKQSIYHQKILNEKEEELEEEEIEEKEKEEKKKNMIVHKIFLLEEPDLSVDLDAWSEWFDRLKTCKEYLTSLL
jgi:hypothetical protein